MNILSKASLLLLCISFFTSIAAQEAKNDTIRPVDKSFGAVLNLSGLVANIDAVPQTDLLNTSSLLVRYKINDDFTFRVGLAPRVARAKLVTTDSIGKDLIEYDSTASQSTFSIFPGLEYHLSGTRRLDPYIAADLELGLVGRLNIGAVRNTTDTTGTSKVTRTITEDGGYALGARFRLGMNYFIAQNLFLGVEYGLGISTVVAGGDREDVTQLEPVSGASTVLRELSASRRSDLTFGIDPSVQITFGYFFDF